MKTLWLALSVLAIANMLAFLAFVGWLKMTDRLDGGRMQAVRQLLSKTITDEKAEKDVEVQKAEAEKVAAAEAEKKGRPPLTAQEQLNERLQASEIDEQRMQAMRASIETLRAPLQAEREALGRERAVLEVDKAAFEAIVSAANARAKDEQFKKTVAVIDSLKSTDAQQVLMEIMKGEDAEASTRRAAERAAGASGLQANAGAEAAAAVAANPNGTTPGGMGRALDYLNAMQPRARSKVITEFTKSDPKLAGELLERLRTYGQVPTGSENLTRVGSTQ
jgi:hypothetical protein